MNALSSPAALRNREPILQVLQRVLPPAPRVLEIAGGSGEHAEHFASNLPQAVWRPTDRDPSALASIAARREAAGLANLRQPVRLDVTDPATWPDEAFDAIVCLNMIHIAPWSAAEGLMQLARGQLTPGGRLVLYGPFLEHGVAPAPSNLAFDKSLKARDPAWGIRRLDDVTDLAASHGLRRIDRVEMPANNLTVVFENLA
jgi:SAM-dependent methyltransferase